MDLSIIIINFNTKQLTCNCIDSIIKTVCDVKYEIIVVDNSTSQENRYVVTEHQKNVVKLIDNVKNNGFGNACNIGNSVAKGKYLLFVNSDVIVNENTIDMCVKYIQSHKNIGALGVRTVLENGKLDHGCKRGFPTPMVSLYYFMGLDKRYPQNKKYGAYRQTFIDEHSISYVDAVSGSFLMMPKTIYDNISGFDEDFFMYGEDLDICYRIKEQKKDIIYLGNVNILHLKGKSGLETKSKEILKHFYSAMKMFYKKHYREKYNFITNTFVYLAIELKYLLDIFLSHKVRRN